MKKLSMAIMVALCMIGVAGCATMGPGGASQQANEQADKAMYQPIVYANASVPGPEIVVLPGEMKGATGAFTQKVTMDNIADCAELELGKANFKILERSDLGDLLKEIQLTANLGDAAALARYRTGKFKSAKWFIKFDILKAEPVAKSNQSFDGQTAGALLSFIPGVGGAVASIAASSAVSTDTSAIWIVGMRYKIMDACSCEQIASDYFEQKMEIGAKGSSFMGVAQTQQNNMTMDSMVQRLVQVAVADIDQKWKNWTPPAPPEENTKKGKRRAKRS
ncbi:MAG: hypothetical protein AAGU11_11170 [Syntrophobacteraceae bacterium]